MIVAFRHLKHDNTRLDKIDSFFTNSKYVHVQIIFSNEQVGGAWIKTGCVMFRTTKDTITHPQLYTYVVIDDNKINETKTYNYIKSRQGQKFSITGSFANILTPYKERNQWYCSNIIFASLIEGGLKTKLNYLNYLAISPQKIFDILTKEKGYPVVKLDH